MVQIAPNKPGAVPFVVPLPVLVFYRGAKGPTFYTEGDGIAALAGELMVAWNKATAKAAAQPASPAAAVGGRK